MGKTNFVMVLAITSILVFQTNSMETIEEKIQEKGNTNLRKLGFNFDIEKTFPIKTFSVYGQKIVLKYRVAVKDGKASNQIIIDSNLGSFKFGNNDGVDTETSNTWSGKVRIFNSRFPPVPMITLGIIAEGTLNYTVKYTTDSKDSLQLYLSGDLKASAEVVSWPGGFTTISTGAEGTIISASGYATVTKNDIIKGFKFIGTAVNTWVQAKAGQKILWKYSYKLYDSWSN